MISIQLVKNDSTITVIVDGKPVDVWYLDRYEDHLSDARAEILGAFLFGEDK